MYRRILVAIDGGHTADAALREAVELAKLYHARLRLVHVIAWPLPVLEAEWYSEKLDQLADQEGREVLAEAVALVRQAGVEPEARVVESFGRRLSQVIVEEARRWRAELIVLGTHGRRGLSHLFLGSVAESVVRIAPVPVLLVRWPCVHSGASIGPGDECGLDPGPGSFCEESGTRLRAVMDREATAVR